MYISEEEWNWYITGYIRDLDDKTKWEFTERIIMAYWWASHYDYWEYFDMDRALEWMYDFFTEYVWDWSAQHESIMRDETEFEYTSTKEFEKLYDQMQSVLDDLEDMIDRGLYRYSLEEKIIIFEDIIHTYHYSGYVFNIQQLRRNFERWYL